MKKFKRKLCKFKVCKNKVPIIPIEIKLKNKPHIALVIFKGVHSKEFEHEQRFWNKKEKTPFYELFYARGPKWELSPIKRPREGVFNVFTSYKNIYANHFCILNEKAEKFFIVLLITYIILQPYFSSRPRRRGIKNITIKSWVKSNFSFIFQN